MRVAISSCRCRKDSWFQHIAQEVPVTSHTDLYDGGDNDYIPFDKLVEFFQKNLK